MDDNKYQAGSASLFATAARETAKYNWHYDYPNQQWNVFDGNGNYVCSFGTADEAREFCSSANGGV
jgi:hypothetical protein